MSIHHATFYILLTNILGTSSGSLSCPPLRSGQCFLDCSSDVRKMVCERVSENELHVDLDTMAGLESAFTLRLWAVPDVMRLGANTFSSSASTLTEIQVHGAPNLRIFPELQASTSLRKLALRDVPMLRQMPLDLLPDIVEEIILEATGVEEFAESKDDDGIPYLRSLSILNQRVKMISRKYLGSFPRLTTLEISNCQVDAISIAASQPFSTANYLSYFGFTRNVFKPTNAQSERAILEHILRHLRINIGSTVNLERTSFPITRDSIKYLPLFAPVKRLSLRGSLFDDYTVLTGIFRDFVNLEFLDVGDTLFPTFPGGALTGLASLRELLMDNNNFRDLSRIVDGIKAANLSRVDLSQNLMETIPPVLTRIVESVTDLALSGNRIQPEAFDSIDEKYGNVKVLSLANNGMTDFSGYLVANVLDLEVLDLSCNRFLRVRKKFFTGLPWSLKVLNLTFCAPSEKERPRINEDAFTRLPRVETLYLGHGFLKTSIFNALKRMSPKSATRLKHLYLDNNRFYYLPVNGDHFRPFSSLQTLDLSGNRLQSIPPRAFAGLRQLKNLRLSRNALFALAEGDFSGLNSLEYLDLSHNNINVFGSGVFSSLPALMGLFLAGNHIENPLDLFGQNGGKKLVQFEVEPFPSCIDPQILNHFPDLRWLYVNASRPVFLDKDPQLDSLQQELGTPMHQWATTGFCSGTISTAEISRRGLLMGPRWLRDFFVRVPLNRRGNKIYQETYALYSAQCLTSKARNVKQVSSLICPRTGDR